MSSSSSNGKGKGGGKRASMVFVCGSVTKGAVEPVSSLFGRKVHGVVGGEAALVALADDGIYTAPEGTLLSCLEFSSAAVGRSVIVGVTQSGSLYSWGTGEMGELGLGPTYTSVDEPKYINYPSTLFTGVSAGATHCTALDGKGNAYSWGQNFDRQLGLYTKSLEEMQKLRSTSAVEDLLFTPRFLPFSLRTPVAKMACGDAFTVVVTRDGALWSWGAGECGQLGTGRCTKRELPEQVVLPGNTRAVDIACGSAHVLALTQGPAAATGSLLTWGMNKRGQLGLDDTQTRHAPTTMPDTMLSDCAKVYAQGHSSAALDATGQLYTWGSTANLRLMRWRRRRSIDETLETSSGAGGGSQHCLRPGLVAAFRGMVVDSFAFSSAASAALVYTNIQSLSPLLGPCKGSQQLLLRGYGIWDSERILVKFTHRDGLGQSRSSAGRFDRNLGAIVCRPPKLVDAGFYDVAVAMDGSTFQPELHSFYAHRDVVATSVSPKLVDLRSAKASTVTTTVRGLSVFPDLVEGEMDTGAYWPRESDLRVFVKLLVQCSPPGSSSPTLSEVVVLGKLLPLPMLEMSSVLDGSDAGGMIASASSLPLGQSVSQASLESVEFSHEAPAPVTLQPITADRTVECVVDLASLGPPGSLLVIRTAVGLNGQDFGPATPELAPVICHSFQPIGASPCCCPAAYCEEPESDLAAASAFGSTSREITVLGNSFIPTTKLPPGTTIEAVVSAELPKKGSAKPVRYERCVPVVCEAADTMTFIMPTIAELLDPTLLAVDAASRPGTRAASGAAASASLSRPASQEAGQAPAADGAGGGGGGSSSSSRPPSQAGSVKSSTANALPSELLCSIKFKMLAPAPPTPAPATADPKSAGGSKAKGSPSKPKSKSAAPEPVPYLSPEAVTVCLYSPQSVTVDPALTRRAGGATLVLQGTRKGGFSFSSSDVRVVFSRPDLGLEIAVSAQQTWMLGLAEEVPVDKLASASEPGAGAESDEAAGLELEEKEPEPQGAGEVDVGGGGSVAASVASLGAGSLGELSVKSTGSVLGNLGQPHKIVVRCGPFYMPRPVPQAEAPAGAEADGPLTLQLDALSLGEGEGEGDVGSGPEAVGSFAAADAAASGASGGGAEGEGEGEASGESKSAPEQGGGAEGEAGASGGAGEEGTKQADGDAAAEDKVEEEPPLLPLLLDWVTVKVYLDGRSAVPDVEGFRLNLFDKLVLVGDAPLAVPKGGATAGTPIVVPVLAGLVESSACIVRLRGAALADGAGTEASLPRVPGSVTLTPAPGPSEPAAGDEAAAAEAEAGAAAAALAPAPYVDTGGGAGSIGFVLPDPATLGVEAEVRGKERFLFVDASLDGGETWSVGETALLQIK